MTSLSDEALISSYRETGQERYINELLQRYHTRVAAWCLRITGDRESAADMAQEVFVKVYRNLDSFRGNSKFGTWVYSIARNHCFNAIRAKSIRPVEVGSEALEPLSSSEDLDAHLQLEKRENLALLQQLMQSSLDETETRVLVLHYVDELPLDTVTRLLKLTNASGAKAHIVSARRKLTAAFSRWKSRAQARSESR